MRGRRRVSRNDRQMIYQEDGFWDTSERCAKYIAINMLMFLKANHRNEIERGLVIGHDNSSAGKRLFLIISGVLSSGGVPLYHFDKCCPTHLVPFWTRTEKCLGGIMIGGSMTNDRGCGIKIFGEDGLEISYKISKELHPSIYKNSNYKRIHVPMIRLDHLKALHHLHVTMPFLMNPVFNAKNPIIYTGLKGAGFQYVKEALEFAKLAEIISVSGENDCIPRYSRNSCVDSNTFREGINKADELGASVILCNDPSSQFLWVMEKYKGEWLLLKAAEMAMLMTWWIIEMHSLKSSISVQESYVVTNVMSAELLKLMQSKHGFKTIISLSEFRCMENAIHHLNQRGEKVLIGFDNNMGFMFGTPEKDGITAAVRMVEIIGFIESRGKSLRDKIYELHSFYGYHLTKDMVFKFSDESKTTQLINWLRSLCSRYLPSATFKIYDLTATTESKNIVFQFRYDMGPVFSLIAKPNTSKIKLKIEFSAPQNRSFKRNFELLKENIIQFEAEILNQFGPNEVIKFHENPLYYRHSQ